MDLIQNFQNSEMEQHFDEDAVIKQTFNSLLGQTMDSENNSDPFDCNICFDSAHDPIVTLCGHLYCWACIFKWVHVQSSSGAVQQQACPVCKADISEATLIPLYCHGPSRTDTDGRKPYCDFVPPRPTVCGLRTLFSAENLHSDQRLASIPPQSQPSSFPHQQSFTSFGSYTTISSSNLVSTTISSIINPTIEMLGELVYTRMFGSTNSSLFTYPVRNSYAISAHNNSRIRRHELQLDKSLNRISIFIFCCCILCLLLF